MPVAVCGVRRGRGEPSRAGPPAPGGPPPGPPRRARPPPPITAGVRAGQYVHVRSIEAGGLPRRLPFPIATADPATGVLTVLAVTGGWASSVRVGDRAEIMGPLG